MKGKCMKRKYWGIAIAIICAAVMIMACGGKDKGPAELAMKAAEEAVSTAKTEAGKIVPDQISALERALASAKDKLAKGDFQGALVEAQGLVGKAKDVIEAAKAKKDELTQTWTNLSQGVPRMVAAVESRVGILSQAKKLPANLTAEALEETKSGLAAAKADWAKAQESFNSGNLAEAVSLANAVKDKAVKAMETLGLPVPAGAKS
jgi:hypothetical protein